jgi:hypothetical protein
MGAKEMSTASQSPVAALLLAVTLDAGERPPGHLLVHRDVLKPGSEATYRAVEEDAARICADLKCPHPHIALESITGPREVWWLNALDSEAEKQRVIDAYKTNRPLTEALAGISKRRDGLLSTDVEFWVDHRADLSRGGAWKIAGVRFYHVTVTKDQPTGEGAVFEAQDGTRYIFRALAARDEPSALAAAAGSKGTVFAVRPFWGMPAREWIAADPDFWKANPAAKPR